MVKLAVLLIFTITASLSAQVTYDGNAAIIGSNASTSLVQDSFTVPSGTDRLLVAFVTRDGNGTVTDSITFNGQQLTSHVMVPGNSGLNSEMWYITLGCGAEISDSVKGYFRHSGGGNPPDVILATASFQFVDQSIVIGDAENQAGQGGSTSELTVNTSNTLGLVIGSVSTEYSTGMFFIEPIPVEQNEIFEETITFNNNASQGSIRNSTGGADVLQWNFSSFCSWIGIGAEILASDSDGDGVSDCNDLCPLDSLKSDPGICGCGLPDLDSDGDGTPDCDDLCPLDSLKTDPGICGCGTEDIDADGNGFADCILPYVTYDSNAVVIGASANTAFVQDTFTVPAGTDRVLVAFVLEDGNANTTSDSVTFSGQQLTRQLQYGASGLTNEIWYLVLGCGEEITDTLKAYFSTMGGSLPDAVVAAATFQFVDQTQVFGDTDFQSGLGGATGNLNFNTADTNGLVIASVATDIIGGMIMIDPDGPEQDEIFEAAILGNNNSLAGSISPASGGTDQVSWTFSSYCDLWVNIGIELLASDRDGDGVLDCNDLCPQDSLKSDPGICGCGVPDLDTDGDGTADCNDLCPLDSLKTAPGICGCGEIDLDTDGDGTFDCDDLCPLDSLKIDPGVCGCGVADVDSDNDGTADCIDVCPNDSLLIADVDSDGDGVVDCLDSCPFDSTKVDPGTCGCGIPDTDSDTNGIPDCKEPGDVLIIANSIAKGPVMQGSQVSHGGDTTLLWSLGNRSGLDSAVMFMQHRNAKLVFGSGNVEGFTIDAAGRVGIGRQPATNVLEVNGNASKSSPGNWLGNSDSRLKNNIRPLDPEETLARLLQIRGVTFEWNDTVTGVARPHGPQYGFLAQDIKRVYPELVEEDANGYMQTAYGTFDPMILEGIRFISQELKSVEDEIDGLLHRMEKLEQTWEFREVGEPEVNKQRPTQLTERQDLNAERTSGNN